MFTFLLVLQAIVTLALITVILVQKSEGGGLGTGGSPTSFLSARGAADFLTRATGILGAIFVVLAIALAVLATVQHGRSAINVDAKAATAPAGDAAPPPAVPSQSTIVPVAGGQAPAAPAAGSAAPAAGGVPAQQ